MEQDSKDKQESSRRKLFDHQFGEVQDSFFSEGNQTELRPSSGKPHIYNDSDSVDRAVVIPAKETSKFRLDRKDYLPVPILFCSPEENPPNWKIWVENELKKPGVKYKLQKAGILSNLISSTQLSVHRDNIGLRFVLRRWNRTTHTFICAWGEFTATLEDVYMILRLPVMGDQSPLSINLTKEESEIESALVESMSSCQKAENTKPSSSPTFSSWIEYFWGAIKEEKHHKGAGFEKTFRLEALLSLWLSKIVFPELPTGIIQRRTFPLAIRIAKGTLFPLAPIFLGNFYLQLDRISEYEVFAAGEYVIETALCVEFLQILLLERIKGYAVPPCTRSQSVKEWPGPTSDIPLWTKWFCRNQPDNPLWYLLDDIGNFVFRPYPRPSDELALSSFYKRAPKGTMKMEYALAILPGCLPVWIDSRVKSISYCPHRTLRQFGYDQGAPEEHSYFKRRLQAADMAPFITSSSENTLLTTKTLLDLNLNSERQGSVTKNFKSYWKKMIFDFTQFVHSPTSCCKPPSPSSIPKGLKLATDEVISFCSKNGMPFTIFDGPCKELIGKDRSFANSSSAGGNLLSTCPKDNMAEESGSGGANRLTSSPTTGQQRMAPSGFSAETTTDSTPTTKMMVTKDNMAEEGGSGGANRLTSSPTTGQQRMASSVFSAGRTTASTSTTMMLVTKENMGEEGNSGGANRLISSFTPTTQEMVTATGTPICQDETAILSASVNKDTSVSAATPSKSKKRMRTKEMEEYLQITAPIFDQSETTRSSGKRPAENTPDSQIPTVQVANVQTPHPIGSSLLRTELGTILQKAESFDSLANQVPSLQVEIKANQKKIKSMADQLDKITSERDQAILDLLQARKEAENKKKTYEILLNQMCKKKYCQGYEDAKIGHPPAVSLEALAASDTSSTDD
ncbi:Aminotransferase-like mobile domain containing protein [Trema orientale]|uniref:Aminotransferase-like mobile domain containing protein n=1 Tax=Trema orientale TaxID=63057 RepID=A0A2P5ESZ9_TREOI|nr:Aminotransferase-like mobile domain containing protein [Trema orientale]